MITVNLIMRRGAQFAWGSWKLFDFLGLASTRIAWVYRTNWALDSVLEIMITIIHSPPQDDHRGATADRVG